MMNIPTAGMQNIINEVIATISRIPIDLPRGKGGDSEWTTEIKRVMRELGKRWGYLVCPDPSNKEWLYDFVWFKNDSENHLCEVALVLESEWSRDPDEIHYDFEKLLFAKAPIKVMIFQNHGDNLLKLWEQLKKGISSFGPKTKDETYILAAFRETEHDFKFELC